MGLDNYIEYIDASGKLSMTLPANIIELFRPYYLIEIGEGGDNAFLNGRKFHPTLKLITKRGFYGDLGPELCGILCDGFNKFIQKVKDLEIMEYLENIYKEKDEIGDCPLQKWIELLTGNEYIADINEIKQLRDIFDICSKNNLTIVASY